MRARSQQRPNNNVFICLLILVFVTTAINILSLITYDDGSNDSNAFPKSHFTNQTSLRIIDSATDKSNDMSRGGDDSGAFKKSNFTNQTSSRITYPQENIAHPAMDGSNDKTKVRQILQKAGVEITPEVEECIPTWSEVTSLYGSKPKIMGLETCATFRNSVPASDAMIGPSGIFNTGTNLLSSLLSKHCTMPHREKGPKAVKGMLWQVPWGKHNPISLRLKHHTSGQEQIIQTNVLPVVTIKDPYHWMGSMCRHSYAANWFHSEKHCPNLIADKNDVGHQTIGLQDEGKPIKVKVRFQPTVIPEYESLAGLWNDWYGDYIAVDSFPRLIIRFEDLLFHLEEVMTQVCECAGGSVNADLSLISSSAKGDTGPHSGASGLMSAIKRYGHEEKRVEGMNEPDLEYARKVLNVDMMEAFGYSYPEKDR